VILPKTLLLPGKQWKNLGYKCTAFLHEVRI
jgi:hypothetical protein